MRPLQRFIAALGLALLAMVPCQAADDDARAIVDKAIKAHGGADAIAKFKSAVVKAKGKFDLGNLTIDYTSNTSLTLPERMRVEVDLQINGMNVTFLQIQDGDKGWRKIGGKDMELHKDALAEMREQTHAAWVATLAPLADKNVKLATLGESKVANKDALGIQVSYKDRRDVNLFFDKETGLLLKSEHRAKDVDAGLKEYNAETYYSEYKEFDGVKVATKHAMLRDGKDFGQQEITGYEAKDKLDDATFAKP